MKQRLATLGDVAKEANVSQQTVSRVLNTPDRVSPRTRTKVMKAMNGLNYVPNRSAQLLAGKMLPALGLITASLQFHAPSQIASAVKSHAAAVGFQVTIAMLQASDKDTLQAALNEFRAQRVGSVIVSMPVEAEVAEQLVADNADIHCLFLDVPPESRVSHLGFDHRDGTRLSVSHLFALGHRHFALLAGPENAISARLRLQSWREALLHFNITSVSVAHGDWSAHQGWEKTLELFRANPEISAVLVANDQMALGVLSALNQLNRKVPETVSVIGYDDTPDSQYFQPALTTVAQDFDLLGRQAVSALIEMTERPEKPLLELLPTQLKIRQSTAKFSETPGRELLITQLKTLVQQL